MIKRFSVLYVGQIDLDNVGADGTPANDRLYPNEKLIQAYDHAVALAKHLTNWASTACGRRSTTSNGRVTSACPT